MKRPKGCVYPDCLNCPLPDCEYDDLEPEDIIESNQRDLEVRIFKQGINRVESHMKYEQTDKAKARHKAYEQTDKAKARRKAYYIRHKETILAKAKAKRNGVIVI